MAYDSSGITAAYKRLGLTPGVSPIAARRRYRELIKESHPDRFPAGSESQTRAVRITQEINSAYETIKRAAVHHEVPLWQPSPPAKRVSKDDEYVEDRALTIDRFGTGLIGLLLGVFIDFGIGSELAVVWVLVPVIAGIVGFVFGMSAIQAVIRILWWLS